MAIFHLHIQTIGRANGQSAVAAAAYRSTSRLLDERTGEVCDYTRKEKALKSGIELPTGAPEWAGNRLRLWNEVEKKENRKNSILAYEMNVAIPAEIEKPDREKLIKSYCKTLTEKGLVCDWSIHAPAKKGDERNIHAHIMFTTRTFENGDWSKNKLQMNRDQYSEFINEKRADWEKCANAALKELYDNQKWDRGHKRIVHKEQYGLFPEYNKDENPKLLKIDRRSLEAQGIDREPQKHQGPAATAMERQGKRPNRARTETGQNETTVFSETQERELWQAQEAIRILNMSDAEFSGEYKKLDSMKRKAWLFATREHLPEIEKANRQETGEAIKKQKEILERNPNGIAEKPNALKNLFYEYQADDGKKYPYEKYEKVQSAIIKKWRESIKANDRKGAGLNKERNLILAVKGDSEISENGHDAINRGLELYRAQEKRPGITERIKQKVQELLATAAEFSGYRNFKNLLDQVNEARAETARQRELERQLPEQRSRGRGR